MHERERTKCNNINFQRIFLSDLVCLNFNIQRGLRGRYDNKIFINFQKWRKGEKRFNSFVVLLAKYSYLPIFP